MVADLCLGICYQMGSSAGFALYFYVNNFELSSTSIPSVRFYESVLNVVQIYVFD